MYGILYYPSPIPISHLKNKGLFHIDLLPDIMYGRMRSSH